MSLFASENVRKQSKLATKSTIVFQKAALQQRKQVPSKQITPKDQNNFRFYQTSKIPRNTSALKLDINEQVTLTYKKVKKDGLKIKRAQFMDKPDLKQFESELNKTDSVQKESLQKDNENFTKTKPIQQISFTIKEKKEMTQQERVDEIQREWPDDPLITKLIKLRRSALQRKRQRQEKEENQRRKRQQSDRKGNIFQSIMNFFQKTLQSSSSVSSSKISYFNSSQSNTGFESQQAQLLLQAEKNKKTN